MYIMSLQIAEPSNAHRLSVASVNWHLWPHCNYHCKFCFARFPSGSRHLDYSSGTKLLDMLLEAGTRKITFVGGEPLLCPWLPQYLKQAKEHGCLTMIVTNGSQLVDFIDENAGNIDWIGLSIDSPNEATEIALGRGKGHHLRNVIEASEIARQYGIRLKLNVTVTREALNQDFHDIVRIIRPDRLKLFQVLHIKGQNDEGIRGLSITSEEFESFVMKHSDLHPIAEDNNAMTNSYVMVDPIGRFFQNASGAYQFSRPILEVGVYQALSEVGMSWSKLVQRGGAFYLSQSGLSSPIAPSTMEDSLA